MGIALAVVLLAVVVFLLRLTWRAPFRALGILVAGMAFHNFVIMLLLRLDTPALLVRAVQAWKEGVLALLSLLAIRMAVRAWRTHTLPRLLAIDGLVACFTALILIYFLLPSTLLPAQVNVAQRLVGIRILLLIPLLYLFGRLFVSPRREDVVWVATVITASAAFVGLFGAFELWFIPTKQWISWGANLLSAWLGFAYRGPEGLPENFFQTTADGLLLRRMVSTYLSPLPIAYTGLLIVPLAVALLVTRRTRAVPRRWFLAAVLVLLLTGMLFSVTRLALAILVAEFLSLALLWRRLWLFGATPVLAALFLAVVYGYPHVGPLLTRDLEEVGQRPAVVSIASEQDPSLAEHTVTLGYDIQYVIRHPLGTGLGTSVHRFGPSEGTGESAIFDVFGELGVLGGTLYLLVYGFVIAYGVQAYLRNRFDALRAAIPMVAFLGGLMLIPITLTSDLWGDFSVTFLFWWAAGASVTLVSIDMQRQDTFNSGSAFRAHRPIYRCG